MRERIQVGKCYDFSNAITEKSPIFETPKPRNLPKIIEKLTRNEYLRKITRRFETNPTSLKPLRGICVGSPKPLKLRQRNYFGPRIQITFLQHLNSKTPTARMEYILGKRLLDKKLRCNSIQSIRRMSLFQIPIEPFTESPKKTSRFRESRFEKLNLNHNFLFKVLSKHSRLGGSKNRIYDKNRKEYWKLPTMPHVN